MTVFDKELIKSLEKRFGQAFYINGHGEVTQLNYVLFAELFTQTYNPIYETSEKKFYFYDKDTGLWKSHEKYAIIRKIGDMICDYADEFQKPSLKRQVTPSASLNILTYIPSCAAQENFFSPREEIFIHCGNGVLVYDESLNTWNLKAFSPDFHSRNRSNIIYDPEAKCPQFMEKLILSAMGTMDAELLQTYAGQCLMGKNLSQTVLILTGTPGSGKSTLVCILEALIGKYNCAELRLEHMGSRFEAQRFIGKTLLTGTDVKSNFLATPSACKLKPLVGNDLVSTEEKGTNNVVNLTGNFNVIITSNHDLYILIDGDEKAWQRRMLIIKYDNPPPKIEISDFATILIDEESAGILNWSLEGARKLMLNNGKIPRTPEAEQRTNTFIMERDPIITFLKKYVKPVCAWPRKLERLNKCKRLLN